MTARDMSALITHLAVIAREVSAVTTHLAMTAREMSAVTTDLSMTERQNTPLPTAVTTRLCRYQDAAIINERNLFIFGCSTSNS
jgi:hypothetical protein